MRMVRSFIILVHMFTSDSNKEKATLNFKVAKGEI